MTAAGKEGSRQGNIGQTDERESVCSKGGTAMTFRSHCGVLHSKNSFSLLSPSSLPSFACCSAWKGMGGAGAACASSDSSSSSGSESGYGWDSILGNGKERPGGGSPGGGGMDKGRTEGARPGAERLPASSTDAGTPGTLALRALARSFFRDFTSLFGHKWQ